MASLFRSAALRPIGIARLLPPRPLHVRGQVLLRGGYRVDSPCAGGSRRSRASRGRGCAPVSKSQSRLPAHRFLSRRRTGFTRWASTPRRSFSRTAWDGRTSPTRPSRYTTIPDSEQIGTIITSAFCSTVFQGRCRSTATRDPLPVVVSPQPSDWSWLPSNLVATNALMVDYQPSDVAWMCSSATLVGHLTVPYSVRGPGAGAGRSRSVCSKSYDQESKAKCPPAPQSYPSRLTHLRQVARIASYS